MQGNLLWMQKPGSTASDPQYQNMATNLGIDQGGWSFGAQFGDLGNTGNQDLVLTNGFYSGNPNRSYWYDFGKIDGANYHVISNASSWPAFAGRSLAGYEHKRLWIGDGEGDFTNVAQMVGFTDRYDGRSIALADLFNNGCQDILEANERGPLLIYKDTATPNNKWIEFQLKGTVSNRDAYGALIKLYYNSKVQAQALISTSGFCSQNDHRIHYGLGANPSVTKVTVLWPSGIVQTIQGQDLKLDAVNHIVEP